jgi:hypothetical protein
MLLDTCAAWPTRLLVDLGATDRQVSRACLGFATSECVDQTGPPAISRPVSRTVAGAGLAGQRSGGGALDPQCHADRSQAPEGGEL